MGRDNNIKRYNKCLIKILSLLITTVMIFSSVKINVYAGENKFPDNNKLEFTSSEEEIGKSQSKSVIYKSKENDKGISTFANILPNLMTFDWVATERSIIIYVTNTGLDSVDLVSGTIKTGNMTKSFTFSNVSIGTSTYSVTVPLKSCHENISISFFAVDGGDTFGSTTSYGSRDIPNSLLNKWSSGGYASKSICLDKHYIKHGAKVLATNICEYVRLADLFRTTTIPAQNIKPYKYVPGATPNVYRYRNNYLYVDVVCVNGQPSGLLVSFGAR